MVRQSAALRLFVKSLFSQLPRLFATARTKMFSHHHAAIYGQDLAGDVAGFGAGEEENGGGDVFGLAEVT